jgi:hypothetical protein
MLVRAGKLGLSGFRHVKPGLDVFQQSRLHLQDRRGVPVKMGRGIHLGEQGRGH